MALVSVGYRLVVELVDTGANTTTRTYELDSADAAEAATDAAAVMAALTAVTTAVIAGYTLGEKFVEAVLNYPASAEIEKQAQITAKIVGQPHKSATFTIPAPDPTIFQAASGPGYNIVDVTDTAMNTYLLLFDSSGPCYISDGEHINPASAKGKRISVKSNKG